VAKPAVILAGSAHPGLATGIADLLEAPTGRVNLEIFPDSELHVELGESVRDRSVYIIQPTGPPAERFLLELLLIADACRRDRAARVIAVCPYFAYARQDRRVTPGEALGGRLVADLFAASGIGEVIAVDLHTPMLEGFFRMPLMHLSAVEVMADVLRQTIEKQSVIVAPDLGAVKLAENYGRLLDLPVAFVHKTRVSAEEVRVAGVTGEVTGRAPLIVDDMISTGATIEGAYRAVVESGAERRLVVAATHGLLVGSAVSRLAALPLRSIVLSDTIPLAPETSLPVRRANVAPLLASAIASG
jgi:ribose-phosphate pyrophosphokinase